MFGSHVVVIGDLLAVLLVLLLLSHQLLLDRLPLALRDLLVLCQLQLLPREPSLTLSVFLPLLLLLLPPFLLLPLPLN